MIERYGAIIATLLAVACFAIAWANAIERNTTTKMPRAEVRRRLAMRRDLRRSLKGRS